MSTAHLPPELLDHIIDLLYGSQTALRDCCLVSKSWIPHTRTHLFTDVKFDTPRTLRSWKETFQDLSPSPAQYTKTLTIGCIQDVTAADAEPGGWIRGFSRVECLAVRNTWPDGSTISLLPFHGFSPVLKSLHVNSNYLLSPQIFDLTLSFPLLEDLDVISHNLESIGNGNGSCRPSTVIQPSNQPMTGSLKLMQQEGIGFIASRLLSLSGGIHFWKLDLRCDGPDDISSTMALVEGCSHTLEYLEIGSGFLHSIDLSKATRLRDSVFRVESRRVDWIITSLRTITPKHRDFRRVAIYLPYGPALSGAGANVRQIAGELIFGEWLELDRLLAQLWELRLIRPKLLYIAPSGRGDDVTDCVRCLLPELTGRGIIDLANWVV